jgi:hypothetical protein
MVSEDRLESRLQAGKTSPTRVNAGLRTDTADAPTTKLEWSEYYHCMTGGI